jgi:hypothetical protein
MAPDDMERPSGVEQLLDDTFFGVCEKLETISQQAALSRVESLLQEQVLDLDHDRKITCQNPHEIEDNIKAGNIKSRLATGAEAQVKDLLEKTELQRIASARGFADQLALNAEKNIMSQVDVVGKVIENSALELSGQILEKRKQMIQASNEDDIANLMDMHYVTLKKYYNKCNAKAAELRNKYEKLYLDQEAESVSRQVREMEAMKRRFESNNEMAEQREEAHKQASTLYEQFTEKVLRMKVSNSNMREDQDLRFQEAASRAKHWRFELSHRLETSLCSNVKMADELYLNTLVNLDNELESLRKFKLGLDLEAARMDHLVHTPLFASRRLKDEALHIARDAPSASNIAKFEAYNLKLGSRVTDLAKYCRLDSETTAALLEKLVFDSFVLGHRHDPGRPGRMPKAMWQEESERAIKDILQRMIENSRKISNIKGAENRGEVALLMTNTTGRAPKATNSERVMRIRSSIKDTL